jgi:capsule polysaccharide export protein KpsC/LpsZ
MAHHEDVRDWDLVARLCIVPNRSMLRSELQITSYNVQYYELNNFLHRRLTEANRKTHERLQHLFPAAYGLSFTKLNPRIDEKQ